MVNAMVWSELLTDPFLETRDNLSPNRGEMKERGGVGLVKTEKKDVSRTLAHRVVKMFVVYSSKEKQVP